MSLETGVVVGKNGRAIMWHVPDGRTAGSLPDSRGLWKCIWEHREELEGFAHSHPGRGMPGPSATDISTFEAIEAALGRRLTWWICTEDSICKVRWFDEMQEYGVGELEDEEIEMLPWLGRLRWLSYNKQGG